MTFDGIMEALAAVDMAHDDATAAERLRQAAYRDGLDRLKAFQDDYRTHATPLAAGLSRLRALRAAYVFTRRPGIVEGEIPPSGRMNGVDVSVPALTAFAEATLREGADLYDDGTANGFGFHLADAGGFIGRNDRAFEERYLLMRFLDVSDPEAHAALVAADPMWSRAGDLVAGWWTERLRETGTNGRVDVSRAQATAFRARLAATVALTQAEDIDVDYGPDAWLAEALDEAGLPEHSLDAWRKSVAWVNLPRGVVLARVGLGGEVEELGGIGPEADAGIAAVPTDADARILDVVAFLVEASVPGAIQRRGPGGIAFALPLRRPDGTAVCLFASAAGKGVRIVDDRAGFPTGGPSPGGVSILDRAGIAWNPSTGEASLDLPSLDGIGDRLTAMGAALVAAADPA